ncbi:MAG: hypothetical protein JXB19_02570 [Bacteroidales bacterium]|nr:hypothetical protein [Bacteroidales bacterium]
MIRKYSGHIAFLFVAAVALLILINQREGILVKRYSGFSPGNTSSIDKIVISQAGDTVILERRDNQWTMNGIQTVRDDRLDFILSCLKRIEIVSPVAKSVKDNVIEQLTADGRFVRIFVGGKVKTRFYVYYDADGIAGTYMMPEQSKDPFMVRLKGYSGSNIEGFFSMNPSSWQENILFELRPGEIREVLLEYPASPQHSFRIRQDDKDGIVLSDLSTTVPKEHTDLQEIQDYLFFFNNIHFEYSDGSVPDAMVSGLPFANLKVVLKTNREIDLKAYYLPVSGNAAEEYDMNRFIGLINGDRDTVMLDYADMDPVFRQIEDFQKK